MRGRWRGRRRWRGGGGIDLEVGVAVVGELRPGFDLADPGGLAEQVPGRDVREPVGSVGVFAPVGLRHHPVLYDGRVEIDETAVLEHPDQ